MLLYLFIIILIVHFINFFLKFSKILILYKESLIFLS